MSYVSEKSHLHSAGSLILKLIDFSVVLNFILEPEIGVKFDIIGEILSGYCITSKLRIVAAVIFPFPAGSVHLI